MTDERFCFATEVDLDAKGDGAVTTDSALLRHLRELSNFDVIYFKKTKYKSNPLALIVFFFQILNSFSRSYKAYFSRGLITSFFLVCFNIIMLRKRKIVARALSVPLVSKEVKFLNFGKIESFLRQSLFLFLERFVYSRVDLITVAADINKQELVQADVNSNKIYVTNFTVGKEFFNQPLKSKVVGAFKFCYVGSFQFYQDLLPVLEAFEIFSKTEKDIELHLIGDGPQRAIMEHEVEKGKLHGVKFVGRVSHDSLPQVLSEMDCFVSITRKPGLSISLTEAAAAGKPIIAFTHKNDSTYNDIFTHSKEILLVNNISPSEIAKTMKLLYEDSWLRNSIAKGARQIAAQNFSENATRKQLEDLIQRVR